MLQKYIDFVQKYFTFSRNNDIQNSECFIVHSIKDKIYAWIGFGFRNRKQKWDDVITYDVRRIEYAEKRADTENKREDL